MLRLLLCVALWASVADSQSAIVGIGGSMPLTIYNNAMFIYGAAHNVEVTFTDAPSPVARAAFVGGLLYDFASSDSPVPAAQYAQAPDIAQYPAVAVAVVPGVNIPRLEEAPSSLVLSGPLLARIYLGNITNWRDPAILALNPFLEPHLPNAQIVVLRRADAAGVCDTFSRALSKFSEEWAERAGFGELPNWPPQPPGAKFVFATSNSDMSAKLESIPYSIGFLALSRAREAKISVARMVNRAGRVVSAGPESVAFAALERGGVEIPHDGTGIDLTDAGGNGAWPITGYSYLIMRKTVSKSTCANRSATVAFWLWFFQSAVVRQLAHLAGVAVVPDLIQQSLGLGAKLQGDIMCADAIAYPSQIAEHGLVGSVSVAHGMMEKLALSYQELNDVAREWEVSDCAGEVCIDLVLKREVDIAAFIPAVTDPVKLSTTLLAGSIELFPTALMAVATVSNVRTTAGVAVSDLVLDWDTIGGIFAGSITSWDHWAIQALNPKLAGVAAPIVVIVCQSGTHETSDMFARTLIEQSTVFRAAAEAAFPPPKERVENDSPTAVANRAAGSPLPPASSYLLDGSVNLWPFDWTKLIAGRTNTTFRFVAAETKLAATVQATANSIGYALDNGKLASMVAIQHAEAQRRTLTEQSVYACGVAFEQTWTLGEGDYPGYKHGLGRIPLDASGGTAEGREAAVQCWPFTHVLYTAVPSSYSARIGADACTRPRLSLEAQKWITTSDATFAAARTANFRVLPHSVVEGSAARLDAVTCNGKTVLVNLPVPEYLSTGVGSFATGYGIFGVVGVVLTAALVIQYRDRPMIRAASIRLLLVIHVGLALCFLSAPFIAERNPTLGTCQTAAWLLCMGFTLCFAPLFAQSWRVYRIFMASSLKVVKISDARLLTGVLVLLGVDAIVLAAWSATDPLRPQEFFNTATDIDGMPYVARTLQCSSSGSTFIGIQAAVKGLLLASCGLMSFSTRQVSSQFGNSKGIALSIYNLIFSSLVVLPVIFMTGVRGNALVLLILFALFWVLTFTWCIVLMPKFWVMFIASAVSASSRKSDGSQFSFFDWNLLQPNLLGAYIRALERHLIGARARYQHLTGGAMSALPGTQLNALLSPQKLSQPGVDKEQNRTRLSAGLSTIAASGGVPTTTTRAQSTLAAATSGVGGARYRVAAVATGSHSGPGLGSGPSSPVGAEAKRAMPLHVSRNAQQPSPLGEHHAAVLLQRSSSSGDHDRGKPHQQHQQLSFAAGAGPGAASAQGAGAGRSSPGVGAGPAIVVAVPAAAADLHRRNSDAASSSQPATPGSAQTASVSPLPGQLPSSEQPAPGPV